MQIISLIVILSIVCGQAYRSRFVNDEQFAAGITLAFIVISIIVVLLAHSYAYQ